MKAFFAQLWIRISTYADRKYWEHFIVKGLTPTPSDVLRYAAHLIEVHGWIRGEYQDKRGRMCALGALKRAAFTLQKHQPLWQSLPYEGASECLVQLVRPQGVSEWRAHIPLWNDHHAKNKREVVKALRTAAKGCTA